MFWVFCSVYWTCIQILSVCSGCFARCTECVFKSWVCVLGVFCSVYWVYIQVLNVCSGCFAWCTEINSISLWDFRISPCSPVTFCKILFLALRNDDFKVCVFWGTPPRNLKASCTTSCYIDSFEFKIFKHLSNKMFSKFRVLLYWFHFWMIRSNV